MSIYGRLLSAYDDFNNGMGRGTFKIDAPEIGAEGGNVLHRHNAGGHGDLLQRATAVKQHVAELRDLVGESDMGESGTVVKHRSAEPSDRVGKDNLREAGAAHKCTALNSLHSIGNGDTGKIGAVPECRIANGRDPYSHGHRLDGIAIGIPRNLRLVVFKVIHSAEA